MRIEKDKQIQKMIDILELGGKSKKTLSNYVAAVKRFLKYFHNNDLSSLNEDDIIEYMKCNYLTKSCSANTYNTNVSSIKFFYLVNFKKDFNNKLLPRTKLAKRLPAIVDKDTFTKILNEEKNLKHKCWLLLAYSSGLRVNEIATLKITDIYAKEHKLKVIGKRNKERYTVLTDITINYLRKFYMDKYYKNNYFKSIYSKGTKSGFLFEGNQNADHISSGTIINYFTGIKRKYNLDENITFHSLRHSFATNFIKNGGDQFILKSILGHASLNTTGIYVHMGRNFSNLEGVNYDKI